MRALRPRKSRTSRAAITLLGGMAFVAPFAKMNTVDAKEIGVQSPSGRRIYDSDETFDQVKRHNTRGVVAEVSLGLAPEGNLGFLLGVLNVPIRRLDLYAGLGIEANPSRQFTGTARYTLDIYGYKPYVSAGYIFRDLYGIGGYSHNLSFEVGYTWAVHQTMRISAGVGVRTLLHFGLHGDSPILAGYTDQALLDEQRNALATFYPIAAIRVSRAF
jgi:hypothetical protein